MVRKNTSSDGGDDFEDPMAEGVDEETEDNEEGLDDEEGELETDDPGEVVEEEGELGEAAESVEPQASESVLAMKAEIEAAIFARDAAPKEAFAAGEAYGGAQNIVGVGIGTPEIDFESFDLAGPGTPVLNIYVVEKCSVDDVKRSLFDDYSVHGAAGDDVAVNVIPTGPIDALAHRFRDRPAPGGISIGNVRRNSAGTLGCLARGRRSPRNRRVLLLSNNHVIALSNAGRVGDSLVQPGRLDGGISPRDRIAILERWVRIDFGGRINYVDCATGWCWHRRVRRELVYLSAGRRRYFRVSNRPIACRVGMIVGKSGRTTQLTAGRITDCNASIRVNYGAGRIARFRDQITIRGLRGDFSRPGDSGSLVWHYSSRRNPVGLLFAGGGGYTFANKIGRVLNALDINLYT